MGRRLPAAEAVDDQFRALQELSRDQFEVERELLDQERGRPWQKVTELFAAVGRSR
jgi:hypothetical protein